MHYRPLKISMPGIIIIYMQRIIIPGQFGKIKHIFLGNHFLKPELAAYFYFFIFNLISFFFFHAIFFYVASKPTFSSTINKGLFLDSSRLLQRYSPNIPNIKSCMPETINKATIKEDQPVTSPL